MQSCAHVRPIWSAAVDPRVLTVRASTLIPEGARQFDAAAEDIRVLRDRTGEHLLIDRGGEPIRLDVIVGSTTMGPVILHVDLIDDCRLPIQIASVRALAATAPKRRQPQLARRLLGLQALDAWAAGASLRNIADTVLGPGDWPGDGEHRKSAVRRLLALGQQMTLAGPRAVLNDLRWQDECRPNPSNFPRDSVTAR